MSREGWVIENVVIRTVLCGQQLAPKMGTARSPVALNLDRRSVHVPRRIWPPAQGDEQPDGIGNHAHARTDETQIAEQPLLGESDLQSPSPLGRPRVLRLDRVKDVGG